jgi:predicted nucleic acid-binding protein
MKPTVYVETSIIGYLTSRPSRDLITSANQQLTREWWENERSNYTLYVSELVIIEAGSGDSVAAAERLSILNEIVILDTLTIAAEIANELLKQLVLPQKADRDALHIAIAATNNLTYLLTWNCKHIANATRRKDIDRVIGSFGFNSPTICTIQELMGGQNYARG